MMTNETRELIGSFLQGFNNNRNTIFVKNPKKVVIPRYYDKIIGIGIERTSKVLKAELTIEKTFSIGKYLASVEHCLKPLGRYISTGCGLYRTQDSLESFETIITEVLSIWTDGVEISARRHNRAETEISRCFRKLVAKTLR